MTEDNTNTSRSTEAHSPRQRSPLLLIGSLLWVMCLIGIVYGWYHWRQRYLAKIESPTIQSSANNAETDDDNGRNGKSIKLIPQKDGSFEAREVTKEELENPWDADGIEAFSFTDTDGHTFTNKDLIGKPFVISFIFTLCRGPCPNVTKEMRELHDRLKDYDFNLVSLTVDPERDTVDVLQNYGKDQHADFARWKFLTGDQAEIYGLIHRSFAMPVKEEEDRDRKPGFEIIHSTNIMLVDKAGRVIGKFDAQRSEDMSRLRKELKRIAPDKNRQ